MRPHQYIKNLFIFLPLFFAMKMTDTSLLINAVIAFIAFSLTASAVYTMNDYCDMEEDRKHPKKKNRPLASGAISKAQAMVIMAASGFAGFALMAIHSLEALAVLAAYVIMNVAYSFYLKHIAILDVTIIATGFVLRLFIGSAVTGIALSMWIVIMTFLLALFLALAKRRDDVFYLSGDRQEDAQGHRRIYSPVSGYCHGYHGIGCHRGLHHLHHLGGSRRPFPFATSLSHRAFCYSGHHALLADNVCPSG